MVELTTEDILVLLRWILDSILLNYIILRMLSRKMFVVRRPVIIGVIIYSIPDFIGDYLLGYLFLEQMNQFEYYFQIDGILLFFVLPLFGFIGVAIVFEPPVLKNYLGLQIVCNFLGVIDIIAVGLSALAAGREFMDHYDYPLAPSDIIYVIVKLAGLWILMKAGSGWMERFRNLRWSLESCLVLLLTELLTFLTYVLLVILSFIFDNPFTIWMFIVTVFLLMASGLLASDLHFFTSAKSFDRQRMRIAMFNTENTMYQIEMTMHLQKEIELQLEKIKPSSLADAAQSVGLQSDLEPESVQNASSVISERLALYRDSLNQMYSEMKYTVYCRNWHLNALLNYYYYRFRDKGVQAEIRFQKFSSEASDSKLLEEALNYLMNVILSEWSGSSYAGEDKRIEIQCESIKGLDVLTIICTWNRRKHISKRTLKSILGESLYHLKIEEDHGGMKMELILSGGCQGDGSLDN